MRIALTITELDPGGAEQCLVHLAQFLKGRGHQVEVFALGPTPDQSLGSSPNRIMLTRQLDEAGIVWKCGPARGAASIWKVTRWLALELDRMNPDIIQSMLFHAYLVTALANRGRQRPHIGGVRVSQPQWWRQTAQRWAVKRMAKLVCVSQSVANHCHHVEHIPLDKLLVIPNGIPVPSLSMVGERPAALQSCLPTLQTPFLLFVGRLSSQKSADQLIHHLDELLEPLPDHHLILLGDGPLRLEMEATIRSARHGSRVHLLGWQPSASLWMQHATLLLLPSKYEGMPNVVLEAMQAQIPVVAFKVEGVAELLGENTVQIVPAGMPQFIHNTHQLALDRELAKLEGQRNRQRAVELFPLEKQMAKYESLYQRLTTQTLTTTQTQASA